MAIDDKFLLEAEASFYEGLSRINKHNQILTDGSINVSFSDSEPLAYEIRAQFYDFLSSHIKSLQSLQSVYETLCEAHGVKYKN